MYSVEGLLVGIGAGIVFQKVWISWRGGGVEASTSSGQHLFPQHMMAQSHITYVTVVVHTGISETQHQQQSFILQSYRNNLGRKKCTLFKFLVGTVYNCISCCKCLTSNAGCSKQNMPQ